MSHLKAIWEAKGKIVMVMTFRDGNDWQFMMVMTTCDGNDFVLFV